LRGEEKYKTSFANNRIEMIKFVQVLGDDVTMDEFLAFVHNFED